MPGIKEPLGIELGLELLKGHIQVPHSVRRQSVTVELIGAVPWKDADTPLGNDFHAVLRPEPQPGGLSPEHDAPQCSLRVLEGKVVMPRGIHLIVGQFSPHQEAAKQRFSVQQLFDQLIHLGHAEDVLFHRSSFVAPAGNTPGAQAKKEPGSGGPPPRPALCAFAYAISCRTKVPRIPLMNFTVSGVSYFLAISTASLMAAPLGMSGM